MRGSENAPGTRTGKYVGGSNYKSTLLKFQTHLKEASISSPQENFPKYPIFKRYRKGDGTELGKSLSEEGPRERRILELGDGRVMH